MCACHQQHRGLIRKDYQTRSIVMLVRENTDWAICGRKFETILSVLTFNCRLLYFKWTVKWTRNSNVLTFDKSCTHSADFETHTHWSLLRHMLIICVSVLWSVSSYQLGHTQNLAHEISTNGQRIEVQSHRDIKNIIPVIGNALL